MKTEVAGRGLAERVKADALQLGFDLVGITSPAPSKHLPYYERWLSEGRHGEMAYLAQPAARARRADLKKTLADVRSVVVVGMDYLADRAEEPPPPDLGVIARYARGRDYHRVLGRKLCALLERIARRAAVPVTGRAYVDTGPLLERELAQRAGLGWFGKNTMLINPRRGSWFFLGVLLVDIELKSDPPFTDDHCGSCTRCLEACPTGALLGRDGTGAPVMDASRCISYLTIEQRGPIPVELRAAIGNRVFGCDICQEVCPFNIRFPELTREPSFAARGPAERPLGVEAEGGRGTDSRPGPHSVVNGAGEPLEPWHPGTRGPSLVDLMGMTRGEWDAFSRGSAIRRAGYAGFKRNVAVALGNWLADCSDPPERAIAVLRAGLDDEFLVREHAAWALERVGTDG